MRVVLSWLREFAPLDAPVEEVAAALDDLGTPVESIERVGEGLDDVVVAKVLRLRPHPGADRVQLVDVDRGGGDALQVVCGAFNMAEGDLVPLATAGAVLPNGMEIGRRKVRGEWSEGMLCAPDELGLPGGHEGILILPSGAEPGAPAAEALGMQRDVVFELEVNPNRPDAMSVAGIGRDLAARFGVPFGLPVPAFDEAGGPAEGDVKIEIVDPDLCGRFLARALRDVRVGPSPAWIASRLALAGMRPINNVVDASNYVMLELGQPNHPYDLALLPGRGLRIRRARAGERMVTLDEVERVFHEGDLLICDAEDSPVGIAGIMGGASSEISDTTREVLLEVAWFSPLAISRTSKRLGLRTEASARFERGADHEIVPLAAERFCALLASDGAAAVAPGAVDAQGALPEQRVVRVRTERVNAVLGIVLADEEIRRYLEPIGFASKTVAAGELDVEVPTWRPDSSTEIDVIEEVARHHGYARIPTTMPQSARAGLLTPYQRDRRAVREILAGAGANEVWTNSFLAPGDLGRAGLDQDAVRVANPLVAEESLLRTSLLPGLLKALAYNAAHRNTGVAVFEIGHVFRRPTVPGESNGPLPDERELVAVALGGQDARAAVDVWHVLAEGLTLADWRLEAANAPGLHPGRTARIEVQGEEVGVVAEVDPDVLAAYGLEERAGWVEVDLERLLAVPHGEHTYEPVSRFPSSDFDLSFIVDDSTPAAAVGHTIQSAAGPLLSEIRLFDVFRSDQVGAGRRSLTYRLRLQAPDRTLTDEETAEVRTRCIEAVQREHPATLRG